MNYHFIKSLRPYRREHWIIISVLLFACSHIMVYYMPIAFANALNAIAGAIFICTLFRNCTGNVLHGFTSFIYYVLIIWSLCLTIHMLFWDGLLEDNFTTVLLKLFNTPYFLPNMIPFVILVLPRNYYFDFPYLWRVMWLLAILYMCYYPYAFWSMTHYQLDMSVNYGEEGGYGGFITHSTRGISYVSPVVLMMYMKKYLKPSHWKCYIGIHIAAILLTSFMARRGDTAISILYLIFVWLVYFMYDRYISKIKAIFIAVLVILCGYALFTNLSDSFFAIMLERGTVDSRSGVEDAFFADMTSTFDWIFGRGWFGVYFDRMFRQYRAGVETGWLSLILRGGLIYLVSYVSVLLLSFINGFFRSKNIFCKSLAVLCLMQIVSLYPYGWPAFNFFHLTIWIGVWVCNNRRYREMNDELVKNIIFKATPTK